MGLTLVEKILAKNAGLSFVEPGQIVEARVDTVMLHDIGTPGIQQPFKALGAEKIAENVECVIIPDHFVPAPTVTAAENLKFTRRFAAEMGVKHYYEVGRGGICHQVMVEKGHVLPGRIIVAPDSHATTYGAIGALGTGFGVTDVAIGLVTGSLWFKVPETVKIVLEGVLHEFVGAKDIALHLLSQFTQGELIYKAVEITGPVIEQMDMSGRLCLANIAYEMGVKVCLIPPDEVTGAYLKQVTDQPLEFLLPDPDAYYEKIITLDLSELTPTVAVPHHPSEGRPIEAVAGVKIQQAFLGSCTNGRLEDLRAAAGLLKGRKIHEGVRLIITPASQEVYLHAMKEGLLDIFIQAGALITNPGCGVCLGGHLGLIASEEVCISSSNRNFKGRMGSTEGMAYLASPAVVAASAVMGEIFDPGRLAHKGEKQ